LILKREENIDTQSPPHMSLSEVSVILGASPNIAITTPTPAMLHPSLMRSVDIFVVVYDLLITP
jgi:hypothetical protein